MIFLYVNLYRIFSISSILSKKPLCSHSLETLPGTPPISPRLPFFPMSFPWSTTHHYSAKLQVYYLFTSTSYFLILSVTPSVPSRRRSGMSWKHVQSFSVVKETRVCLGTFSRTDLQSDTRREVGPLEGLPCRTYYGMYPRVLFYTHSLTFRFYPLKSS